MSPAVKKPISTSTNNVSRGIFNLQYRHFPEVDKKDRMGNKSNQASVFLHLGQKDLPKNDLPVRDLSARQSTRLPKISPNKNPNIKLIIN